MSCPDQLIGGVIFCGSEAGRDAWIKRLNRKHPTRFNHFVKFRDRQGEFALMFDFSPCQFELHRDNAPYVLS